MTCEHLAKKCQCGTLLMKCACSIREQERALIPAFIHRQLCISCAMGQAAQENRARDRAKGAP